MADLQKQFLEFHDVIAITPKLEKKLLAGKREIILQKLSASLKKRRDAGEEIPEFTNRNQGSYAMDTGNKPVSGEDYDLDVALLFSLAKDGVDPLVVKEWVYTALKDHTSDVRWREPCITVFYSQNDEPVYHVDFAVYAAAQGQPCYLARGKEHSAEEYKYWEEADPAALIDTIKNYLADADERAQFRRVIRELKRWKDERFPSAGNAAPTGIALTACALAWFSVSKTEDRVANTVTFDDQAAVRALVERMLANFQPVYDSESGSYVDRLRVTLPVPPGNDLLAKMTNAQMVALKDRLEKLRDALIDAQADPDPHTAAKLLSKQFGPDFPVPEKQTTAVARGKAIASPGNSA